MVKKILKEHKKHAKLSQPNFGTFSKNEYAFIGAPCDRIKQLVGELMALSSLESKCIYIDETHGPTKDLKDWDGAIKNEDSIDIHSTKPFNRNSNWRDFNDYDFCFVNGNHFKSKKQIVILDPKKKESLSKKLDKLTNVVMVIATDECNEAYEFLTDNIENESLIRKVHISDVSKIWEIIKSDFEIPKLKALVLAGGKSQRMGKDKGLIEYHGKEQRLFLYDLLENMDVEPYISCRQDQINELEGRKLITDKFLGLGPFGAIASAFMEDPDAAWLVVPCDLPFISKQNLLHLINNRKYFKNATAYLNNETSFPEPLISIWEPKMYLNMLGFLAQGYSCPRKVLINTDVHLINVSDQSFMMNVNTPEEFADAMSKIKLTIHAKN